jgi:hypothetical protein
MNVQKSSAKGLSAARGDDSLNTPDSDAFGEGFVAGACNANVPIKKIG